MQQVKAISFDLDDTLWECDSVIRRAENALLSYLEERCDLMKSRFKEGDYYELKVNFMRDNIHLAGDVTRMRKAFLTHILADCDLHKDMVEEAFSHFYRVRSDVELYTDSKPVLQVLSDHYPLAALTNGNANLRQIGLEELFVQIHYASLECPAKPEPDMFHRTCEALSIDSHELLHVGDNPETDIEGARNAGALSVWINRTEMSWPAELQAADYEIKNLNELLELFSPFIGPY